MPNRIVKKSLRITIKSIKGNCPVFHAGQQFFIRKGYILDSNNQPLCMHALSSLMPFYSMLSLPEIKPKDIGLGSSTKAYIQCPDPCDLTNGGNGHFLKSSSSSSKLK